VRGIHAARVARTSAGAVTDQTNRAVGGVAVDGRRAVVDGDDAGVADRVAVPFGRAGMEVAERQRDVAERDRGRRRCAAHVFEDDDRRRSMDVQRPADGECARGGGVQRQQDGEQPHEDAAGPVQCANGVERVTDRHRRVR
jgi:hypothetical protein